MSKKDFQSRIDKIKKMPAMLDMKEWFGKAYEFGRQIDLSIGQPPGMTMETFDMNYIKQNGTKEEYVKQEMEQWNRQHPHRSRKSKKEGK
ncbi:MAG: hypothetical protein ABSF20_01295 [Smithella sp.]|jgi:hypothetical protein